MFFTSVFTTPSSIVLLGEFAQSINLFILAIIIGTLESSFARLRMTHVFEFIFTMSSISLIILSLTMISMNKHGG